MAQGDLTVFDEAKAYMVDGGWEAADDIKLAICDNTTAPTAGDAVPSISGGTTNYTEVGAAGSYTAGGTSLGNLGTLVTEAAGTMTFDSATNPTWAQNASNDTDAYWGIIYNDTDATNRAIAFVDLGGPVDMTAGDLTVTWNASGIYTIT
jgi:hypothetical protein